MPWPIDQGMLPYFAYMLGLGIPLVIMVLSALLWLRLEGRNLSWSSLKERFRLNPMGVQGLVVEPGSAAGWQPGGLLANEPVQQLAVLNRGNPISC